MLTLEILFVVVLILSNAVLAMAELAIVSSRRGRLQALARKRNRGARIALRLLEDPTNFLSTVQIGITLVGVLAGAFSGATIAEQFGGWLGQFELIAPYGEPVAFAFVVVVVSSLQLMFGELVPKRIALGDPERIAAILAPAMRGLSRVAAPAAWFLTRSTEAVLRVLGLRRVHESTVTEDEVRLMLAEGTRAGVFMPKEREMIEGVLRLSDRTARAIMTPRSEVAWLDEQATAAEVIQQAAQRRLSRFPVCRGSIDNAIGVVHMKDLARVALSGAPLVLAEVLVPPLVVLDGTPVLKLLDTFRRERLHLAIVVDEYGATQGVVTPADILEAVAGALPERGDLLEPSFVRREDGSWLVDGSVGIDEFEDRVGTSGLRGSGSFDTLAGYALYRLGRLPSIGDSFTDRHGRYEVVDMDGRRIDKLLFVPRRDDDG
jgi:putative hemolysin